MRPIDLDMGFIPDIEEICTKLPTTRQTLLFSATMPPPIKKLADRFLSNPKTIEVARPATASATIDQRLFRVDTRRKKDALVKVLRRVEVRNAIIFCNRKTTVRDLATSLKRAGFSTAYSGRHETGGAHSRTRQLQEFQISILVARMLSSSGST